MLHSSGEKNRRTTVTAVGRALVIVCLVPPGTGAAAAGAAARQPRPVPSEKEARTPAQGKINSQILYEIYRRRGEARRKGVPPGPTGVAGDARGRAPGRQPGSGAPGADGRGRYFSRGARAD